MAGPEIETLLLVSKLGSKEDLAQICEDAYAGRKNKAYKAEVINRTCLAASLETPHAEKLLRNLAALATRSLHSGWENPEEVVTTLQCDKELTPTIATLLPLWRNLALKYMLAPPRLVDFSTQVCSKSGVNDSSASQGSCLLYLTLDEDGEKEQLCMELSKSTIASVVTDLGRVRDQLSAISGHK